jgi:uncharacterized protein YjbJ (UPF0337 family)
VSVMEDEWTDKRMDDFADRVGRFEGDVKDHFDKVDDRFDRFEGDVKERFDKVDDRFDRFESSVDRRFDRVEGRLDTMTWAIFGSTATIVAVLIAQIFFG